jgi:hypothetical protein
MNRSRLKRLIITFAIMGVLGTVAIFYSSVNRPRKVIGFDNTRIWASVQRYLADEAKSGHEHHGPVVIEDLRRAGYMDMETYQYVRTQMTNVPPQLRRGLAPGYKNTNNIMWITMPGKTVTMLSDHTMD